MSEERLDNIGGEAPQESATGTVPRPHAADQGSRKADDGAQKLLDALGLIDDGLVEEALPAGGQQAPEVTAVAGGKKRNWVAIAAGGIGAIVVIWVIVQLIAGLATFSFNTVTSSDDAKYTGTSGKAGTGGLGATSTSPTGTGGSGIGWKPSDMLNGTSTGGGATSGKDSSTTTSTDTESSTWTGEALAPSADAGHGQGHPTDMSRIGKDSILTAGVWNDNENWPFFSNLVDAGRLSFPIYGLDPVRRVKVTLKSGDGPARDKAVELRDGDAVLWKARTDKDGVAYLFYAAGEHPSAIKADGNWHDVSISDNSGQGATKARSDEFEFQAGDAGSVKGVQAMFILDTTGSMADELSYLQEDFGSIAQDVGGDGISYSANFYRDAGDAYVVKTHGFTSNADDVKAQFAAERADGGGDTPEAVAEALEQCIRQNGAWADGYAHIAFLILDAPPHDGTDATIRESVKAAAEKGIKLVPVIASNPERGTELFGRACAAMTGADYVFLTDDSGVGDSHLDPIIGDYAPEKLHDVIVRLIQAER